MARRSDDFDSTVTNFGVFIFGLLLTGALFASDWWFGKTYLTPTLVGILIGAPLGWIGASVNYFFQRKQDKQNGGRDDGR